jgi:type IV secretion system protein TrbD
VEGPREVVFHRSLNRPNLMMGGERELVMLAGVVSVLLIFDLMTWWSIIIGVVWFPIAVGVLAKLGKADPLMRKVATRSFSYQDYYPAKASLRSPSKGTPKSWK